MLRCRFATLFTAGATLALLAIACGGNSPAATPFPTATTRFQTSGPTTPPTRPPSATTGPLVTGQPMPTIGTGAKTFPAAPALGIDANKRYFAVLNTNKGTVRLELLPKQAPQTVNSFVFLARNGYYNGVKFHRVIGVGPNFPSGFMIQGGDPYTVDDSKSAQWGTGTPGYSLPDEFLCADGKISNQLHPTCTVVESAQFTKGGQLAMANTGGPHTGGSQFFITLAAHSFLNGGYTLFGQVQSGMDIVQAIGAVSTDCTRKVPGCVDRPDQPVIIQSVTIEEL